MEYIKIIRKHYFKYKLINLINHFNSFHLQDITHLIIFNYFVNLHIIIRNENVSILNLLT